MPLDFLTEELAAWERKSLLRVPPSPQEPAGVLDFTSNDYLGLAQRPPFIVSRETPVGAGASRLIHGTHPAHEALEAALATWVGQAACLLFSSGYAANLGVLQALVKPEDLVLSDELNHASLIDGCRLSRAEVRIIPHLQLTHFEAALMKALEAQPERRCWVVTESYFSMDGDGPDLKALERSVRRHPNAHLIVDDAHALGVFGPEGAGRCAALGVSPDVLIGTLGKSLGGAGAFVCGSEELRLYLWNRARSFVFSTGTSPWLSEELLARLEYCRKADAERTRLLKLATRLLSALRGAGIPIPAEHLSGPIIPVHFGDNPSVLAATQALSRAGLRTAAIRYPTVPQGSARLRITLNAQHTDNELQTLINTLIPLCKPSSS